MSGVPGRSRPNILLIVSDDHGYADRGPSSEFATPALDRLAAEGVTCTEAYVSAPICSPSRAGMITGRHQTRWGARWFESSAMAPDDVPTLAELLGRRSYATGYFGKVHYGTTDAPGSRACPPRHGFDESFYGLSYFHKGRLNYLRRGEADADAYGDAAGFMGVGTLWWSRATPRRPRSVPPSTRRSDRGSSWRTWPRISPRRPTWPRSCPTSSPSSPGATRRGWRGSAEMACAGGAGGRAVRRLGPASRPFPAGQPAA